MANEEHLEILKQGVKKWKHWRLDNSSVRPDFVGANFSGMNLSGFDFINTDFSDANLSGAQLTKANISGANLSNADFSQAKLQGTYIKLSRLEGTNFTEADLEGANLEFAKFIKVKLKGVNFKSANLTGANFFQLPLDSVNFERANLTYVDFFDTNLVGANLIGANLHLAKLRNADLKYMNLKDTNLGGADLEGADLEGADLEGADLEGADLRGGNLCNANLSKANFYRANLEGINLEGMNLKGCCLKYTKLSGAKLERTNLEGANLEGANFEGANLKNINLCNADLSNAILDKAVLFCANLKGANLKGVNLKNVSFKFVTLTEIDFRLRDLVRVVFDEANLTGVKLWESQRAGWSVKNVICEYAYFDEEGTEKTEFAPGEFERLYSDKTKIVLHFKGGISPLEIATLPALIRHLEDQHGRKISLQSVNDGAGSSTVILRIDDDDEIPVESRSAVRKQLQASGQEIITVQRERIALLEGQVEALKWTFDKVLETPKIQLLGGNMGDTYNNSGQAGAIGPNAMASNNQFIQNFGQQINLIELAKELGTMREKLKEEAASTEEYKALAQVSEAEDAAKANNPSGVVSALKSGGSFLLDIAKRLGVSLAANAIEEAMKGS